MSCTCKENQETLKESGVLAGGIFHDFHCTEAHAEAESQKVKKPKAPSQQLTFDRGAFPLQKPGEVTAVVISGRIFMLDVVVPILPGQELLVSAKQPLQIVKNVQGLPKRARHSLCVVHQGCEVTVAGQHIQIGGANCKKHPRCSILGDAHTPWPPVVVQKRHVVK